MSTKLNFQTALASINAVGESQMLDLTPEDYDFLTGDRPWLSTDRGRARRCVEACCYGALDYLGFPRFPLPVEFIAAAIAFYVHAVNLQTAALIMEGAEYTDEIIQGDATPLQAKEIFAHTLAVRGHVKGFLHAAERHAEQQLKLKGEIS